MDYDKNLPDCHAEGKDHLGYDPESAGKDDTDATCANCGNKWTCLPAAVVRRLPGAALALDAEVAAVERKAQPLAEMEKRRKRRLTIIDAGKPIPEELRVTNPAPVKIKRGPAEGTSTKPKKTKPTPPTAPEHDEELLDEETTRANSVPPPDAAAAPTETTGEDAMQTTSEQSKRKSAPPKPAKPSKGKAKTAPARVVDKGVAKVAKAKKAAAKVGSKKKMGRPPLPRLAKVSEPTYLPDGRLQLPSGRVAPGPRKLDKVAMKLALARLDLGTPFKLKPGMAIEIAYRGGGKSIVKIKDDGFYFGGKPYASLTTAAMHVSQRVVSGNDFFNLAAHGNVSVTGEGVPGGKFSRPRVA